MSVGCEHSVALDVGSVFEEELRGNCAGSEQRVEIFIHLEVATQSTKKSPEVAV